MAIAVSHVQNIAGIHDLLNELRVFAVAQGWVNEQFVTSSYWNGPAPYAFDPGPPDESFLELSSTGFGSQLLNFRFRTEDAGATPNHEWLQMGAHRGLNMGTNDNASATHPVQRDNLGNANWNSNRYTSWPTGTIPETWFVGNAQFIFVVSKLDSLFIQMLAFGTMDLVDSAETEAWWAGWNTSTPSASNHWFNHNTRSPMDNTGSNQFYYNGGGENTANWSFYVNSSDVVVNGYFGNYGHIIKKNAYSEIRPIIKQLFYTIDDADSQYKLIGSFWLPRVHAEGYAIGEEITYGPDSYLVFPNGLLGTRNAGFLVPLP